MAERLVWLRGVKIKQSAWRKLQSPELHKIVGASSREETIRKIVEEFVEHYGKGIDIVVIGKDEPKTYFGKDNVKIEYEETEQPAPQAEEPHAETVDEEELHEMEDNLLSDLFGNSQ